DIPASLVDFLRKLVDIQKKDGRYLANSSRRKKQKSPPDLSSERDFRLVIDFLPIQQAANITKELVCRS
ncbi:hypothetical protein, partial [Mesobacillus zeae]